MSKKQQLLFGAGALILFFGIGASWLFWWGKGSQSNKSYKPNTSAPTQEAAPTLSKKKKPQIELDINHNRSGATLIVSGIDSSFSQVEYELIYVAKSNSQEIERGVAGGPIDVPTSREIKEWLLFGTESCTTSVCHQHIDKNVSQGRLTIRLINNENQSWAIEKDFLIKKTDSGYQAIWQE